MEFFFPHIKPPQLHHPTCRKEPGVGQQEGFLLHIWGKATDVPSLWFGRTSKTVQPDLLPLQATQRRHMMPARN